MVRLVRGWPLEVLGQLLVGRLGNLGGFWLPIGRASFKVTKLIRRNPFKGWHSSGPIFGLRVLGELGVLVNLGTKGLPWGWPLWGFKEGEVIGGFWAKRAKKEGFKNYYLGLEGWIRGVLGRKKVGEDLGLNPIYFNQNSLVGKELWPIIRRAIEGIVAPWDYLGLGIVGKGLALL